MGKHDNLNKARNKKNDEFYTRLEDVEKELDHYKHHFKDKIVYCNCDDPVRSVFWEYFHLNFKELELKRLISTYYDKDNPVYKTIYEGGNDEDITVGIKTVLEGNGDFRSKECTEILKDADIIVDNPPFSLSRTSYIPQLFKYHKKFLIIGDLNWITYKTIFPLLKNNSMWFGYNNVTEFKQPDGTTKKFGNKVWFTNLDIDKRHKNISLKKKYSENEYTKYANYDGINISKVSQIPCDYDGVMGVPITFMSQYNPDQFEIIGLGIANLGLECGVKPYKPHHKKYRKEVQKKGQVDGDLYMVDKDDHPVVPYARILIRKKQ